MIHPDYQYTPQIDSGDGCSCRERSLSVACLVRAFWAEARFAAACLGGSTFQTGFLTFAENFLIGAKLSEYHTGYRAFSRQLLEAAAIANELRRFCFRQSDPCANHCPWLRHWGGDVPGSLHARSVIDQLPQKRALWIGCLATAVRFRLARWGLASTDRLTINESATRAVARSISSSHDVMAVDPHSLPVPRCPMSWLPDVIGAANIIAPAVAVVGPIADLYSDGTRITPVIWSVIIRTATIATIIGSVAREPAVIASTSY